MARRLTRRVRCQLALLQFDSRSAQPRVVHVGLVISVVLPRNLLRLKPLRGFNWCLPKARGPTNGHQQRLIARIANLWNIGGDGGSVRSDAVCTCRRRPQLRVKLCPAERGPDCYFLYMLKQRGIKVTSANVDDMLYNGRAECGVIASRGSVAAVQDLLRANPTMPTDQAAAFIGLAEAAYCPQYASG